MTNSLRTLTAKIAVWIHDGQKRRGGEPYIFHPVRVANSVNGDDKKIVALLHDTIEDCPYEKLDELQQFLTREFSKDIQDAISLLTKDKDENYESYIRRIKENEIARDVKIADIIDNLTSNPTRKQQLKYREALKILTLDK